MEQILSKCSLQRAQPQHLVLSWGVESTFHRIDAPPKYFLLFLTLIFLEKRQIQEHHFKREILKLSESLGTFQNELRNRVLSVGGLDRSEGLMGSLSQVASASLAWVSDPTHFQIPRPCFWRCQFVFKGNQMRILWSFRLSPCVSPCTFQGLISSSVIHKSGTSGLDSGLNAANLANNKSSSSSACWHCL